MALLVLLVVVLALVLGGIALWNNHRDNQQDSLAQGWSESLDAWREEAPAVLPDQASRLSTFTALETADDVAALRAECERVQGDASADADLPEPPSAPVRLETDTAGYQDLQARRTSYAEAMAAYHQAVAEAAATVDSFCEPYAALAEVDQAQVAAEASFNELLGECSVAETGCLPEDTEAWGAVAQALTPAFTDPAARRSEIFATGCPAATLGDVCALLAEQNSALVPLYQAYGSALDSGSREDVEAARATLSDTLDAQRTALTDALAAALPEADLSDPDAVLAAEFARPAQSADSAFAAAESALLAVVG